MSRLQTGNQRRVVPINAGLLQLIRAKRERHWAPSAQEMRRGFRGWHQRGYLPHFDAPGVTQIVTFMLADSFPVTRRREWEPILLGHEKEAKRRKLEEWLDRGHGECWLRKYEVAELVEVALLEGRGSRYELQAWVIMPNHVHLVVDVWDTPLVELLREWKGKSSRLCNRLLGRAGPFWQEDYFDTCIRNQEHLAKAIRYVEQNPGKAMLVPSAREWRWSSARKKDLYGRLPWQVTQ
jgi:REP-associated tyrosine transposase